MSRLAARLNRLDAKAPPHIGKQLLDAMRKAVGYLTNEQANFFVDYIAAGNGEREVFEASLPLMFELAPDHAAWASQRGPLEDAPPLSAPREAWAAYGMTPPPLPPPGLAHRLLLETDQQNDALERAVRLQAALELLMAEAWPR